MDRIVIITTNIAPYRLKWCEELAKYYDVTIYYSKDREKDRDKRFLKHGSQICHVIKMRNRKDTSDPLCLEVISIVNRNPDALILFDGYGPITNILGLFYCHLINRKVFVNVDGYPLGEKTSRLKNLLKKHIISRYCPEIFCSSQQTKQHLIEYGARAGHIYVHNFSSVSRNRVLAKPLSYEEKIELRKKLGIDAAGRIVLGVGQFIPRKRFEDLIQAVISCKSECDLYILGGKPTPGYLQLIEGHQNIHFIDFVPPEEVDDYYKMADLFVLASQTDVWGLVLNEAIANGLPIISSDNCVAGLSLVKDNGILYETGNVTQLAEAIDLCLSENNLMRMSRNSIEVANAYNIEGMVDRQLPVIQKYFNNAL